MPWQPGQSLGHIPGPENVVHLYSLYVLGSLTIRVYTVEVLRCKYFLVTEIHVQYNSEILTCYPIYLLY